MPSPELPESFDTDVREAVLALEGTIISEFQIPLPGSLKDLAKASTLVSGVVEDRIPALLNSVRTTTWDEDGTLSDYEFRKFDIGFPDILLVRRSDPTDVLFEIEAKSWYVLASDPLTARFLTSTSVINEGTLVMIVGWILDGVVAGSPVLLRVHVDSAKRLAEVRDAKWEAIEPEGSHRVVDPENAEGLTRNLIKTQARGEYRTSPESRWQKDSDNYGKLHRIYDEALQTFESSTVGISRAGKTLQEWKSFIKKREAGEGLNDA